MALVLLSSMAAFSRAIGHEEKPPDTEAPLGVMDSQCIHLSVSSPRCASTMGIVSKVGPCLCRP